VFTPNVVCSGLDLRCRASAVLMGSATAGEEPRFAFLTKAAQPFVTGLAGDAEPGADLCEWQLSLLDQIDKFNAHS
jgi:hypothetical protein